VGWLVAVLAISPACSLKKLAVGALGGVLTSGGAYGQDDDPELVRDAAPFALKTMEALLAESPRHRGLLLATSRGFTEYTFAFVQQEADFIEESDLRRATALRERAKRLYQRARDYGFRGLEADIPGFRQSLLDNQERTLAKAGPKQVPFLYWTALSWAGAMSLAKDDSELTADQHVAEAMMKRALVLDEGYDRGTIHDFFIAYEGGRKSVGGSLKTAREHFERSLALAQGARVAPFVGFAETVSVAAVACKEFESLLKQALEVDTKKVPELQLVNLVYQKRARWLLEREDEFFVE
jgi:predicted anti-sigma-YlaC factor YlaD